MDDTKELLVDWRGAVVSERLRACAEAQTRRLDRCGRMRSLSIECRRGDAGGVYRVCCRCSDRGRSITASRAGLGLSIEAFRAAQLSYCIERGKKQLPRASS